MGEERPEHSTIHSTANFQHKALAPVHSWEGMQYVPKKAEVLYTQEVFHTCSNGQGSGQQQLSLRDTKHSGQSLRLHATTLSVSIH